MSKPFVRTGFPVDAASLARPSGLFRLVLAVFLFLPLAVAAAGSDGDSLGPAVVGPPVPLTVHRSPTCLCCGKWVAHLKRSGFVVNDRETPDMDAIKDKYGVPVALRSCHTAIVEGYVVEGHVPAGDIRELLKARPKSIGLTVPGMPVGTPGMEMGGRRDPFATLMFDESGQSRVFHDHRSR